MSIEYVKRDMDAIRRRMGSNSISTIEIPPALITIANAIDAIVARLPPEPEKKRAAGWYWVKLSEQRDWVVRHYDGEMWAAFINSRHVFPDKVYSEITSTPISGPPQ